VIQGHEKVPPKGSRIQGVEGSGVQVKRKKTMDYIQQKEALGKRKSSIEAKKL
jgi:hypothetical protein